jgi:hypothetical protein
MQLYKILGSHTDGYDDLNITPWTCTSETSVDFQWNTRGYIPENISF